MKRKRKMKAWSNFSNWRNWRLPAGLVASAAIGLALAAYYGAGFAGQLLAKADERWLLAQSYRQDRLWDQKTSLERDRRALEAEVQALRSKQRYRPAAFAPADRDRLDLQQRQLGDVMKQLDDVDKLRQQNSK